MKRKILFSSSMLFGSLLIPLASIVSCGPKKTTDNKENTSDKKAASLRYDVNDDNQLIIEHSFSSTDIRKAVLEGIIDKYNETQKDKPDFVPVEAVEVKGGYGTTIKNLEKKFQAKEKEATPNLIVDYPDTAAILRQYRMELNAADAINKDDWIPEFLEINNRIGGIEAGGIYAVPISLSSEILSIDAPLFAYVVDVWNKIFTNKQIDVTTDSQIKTIYDKGEQSTEDLEKIKDLWGEGIVDVSKRAALQDNAEIPTEDIFTHYDKMIAFVNTAQKLLGITAENEYDLHMLGNDSPVNFIQELSFLYGDAELKNFIFTRDNDGEVNMDFLTNQKSAGYKNLKKAYELIEPAIHSGALWLGGNEKYSSTLLTSHKMMFDISSASSYTQNFITGKGGIDIITHFDDTHVFENKGHNRHLKYESKGAVIEDGGFGNIFHPYGTKLDKNKKPEKYEYVYIKGVSLNSQADVDNFFEGETQAIVFLKVNNKNKEQETKIDEYLAELARDGKEIPAKKIAHDVYGNPVYIIRDKYVRILSPAYTLQKTELHTLSSPGMLSSRTKGIILPQGQSLIPVHANEHEDKGTMAFLKWFTDSNEKYEIKYDFNGEKTLTDVTPIFAWMKGTNYISPIKGAFDDGGELEQYVTTTSTDEHLQEAYWTFQVFKNALNNEDVEILNPPVGPFTDELKNKVIGSLLRDQIATSHAGETAKDFNQFYSEVKTQSQAKGIIK